MFVVLCLVIGVIGLFALVRYLEYKGVFFPSRVMNQNPSALRLTYEDRWVTTADGVRVHGWLVTRPNPRGLILYFHGNAGNISDRVMKLKFFHDLGFNVYIVDYRGYGLSEGVPTEKGLYLDADAVYEGIQADPKLKAMPLLVYGTSLGGVVAIDLASRREVTVLVVDSTLTSARDMAKILYPYVPSFFMQLSFDSISKVPLIKAPTIFLHSPDDRLIPFWMGQALYAKGTMPKRMISMHGGHNDAQIANDPETAKAFDVFIKEQGI